MKRRFYNGLNMARVQSVAEMAHLAQRRLPRFAWEYLAGGAEDERCMARNIQSFSDIGLRSRTLVPNHPPQLNLSLLGKELPFPMLIAPTGFNGMLWKDADLMLAKAAEKYAMPMCLSTVSNASMEEVRQAAPKLDLWFQLYGLKDPKLNQDMLNRAKAVGVDTLVVTTDAFVLGNREWDRRSFKAPQQLTLRHKLDVLCHPRWLANVMVPNGVPMMGNLLPYLPRGKQSALGTIAFLSEQMNNLFDWDALADIRKMWSGKLILKGILHPEDAKLAVAAGVDGLIVTNHGGRQLDSSESSLSALKAVRDVIPKDITVLLDSGIRRGSDVIKARALGADAVLLGRATLFGVAAGGQAGVERVIALLQEELKRDLNLMGVSNLHDLKPEMLFDQAP